MATKHKRQNEASQARLTKASLIVPHSWIASFLSPYPSNGLPILFSISYPCPSCPAYLSRGSPFPPHRPLLLPTATEISCLILGSTLHGKQRESE